MIRGNRDHNRPPGIWLALTLVASAASSVGCDGRREPLGEAIDRSVAAGTRALISAQSPDGTWRSRTYGALKDGLSLTPTVLKAVVFAPDVGGSETARRRGAAYLVGRVRPDGTIDAGPFGLSFPVYSAAEAAIVLTRVEVAGAGPARLAWLDALRERQLAEDLGWDPADLPFGAWGDAVSPSVKADAGSPADADLSSTLFAVGSLRIAGASADDPAVRKAMRFVVRCQNLPEEGEEDAPDFDDGGFFFTPTDPVRNKAGVAGTDPRGRIRYHSYGSATADGLRALLRCGLSPAHPRVVAARRWLERHFSAEHNPGAFEPARAAERDATFFYYAWSLAHAFRALGGRMEEGVGRETAWAEMLARELIRRQRADGTWSNRLTASKEDDPLVATPLALGALGLCRAFVPR
jgi:squalene-hopene/tetraprenyl-beta-curcumene cyclase